MVPRVHLNAMNEAHATIHEAVTTRLARQQAGPSASAHQFAKDVSQTGDLFIEAVDECHTQLALAT